MKAKSLVVLFFVVFTASFAQEKMSKADKYFYGYSYRAAIAEYKKELAVAPLKNSQLLNLADSYYKMGDFKNASKYYLDVNKRDTTISVHRYNKMLQSLAKTSNLDRVKTFLNSKRTSFSNELLENAQFNYELLQKPTGLNDLNIFSLSENSSQDDFAPAFYKDRLLFSSGRVQKNKKTYEPSGESYLDIYVSRIGSDGNILNSNPFSGIPENSFHEATPNYSEELGRLFYVLSNSENGQLLFDENGKNTLAIGMVNSNGKFDYLLKDLSTSFYYPFYDAQKERLYFAANFNDSYGGTDIYYVYANNGQIMSRPTNLGPRVNSPGNEIAPYVLNDNLYFSSDVFYGLGGMDIYKTNILVDGSFGIPVNLGEGLNSEADDFGFIIKDNGADGFFSYFSSNRKGGKGGDDLYGVKFNDTPGLKTFSLRGSVVNLKSRKGISKAQVRILGDDGSILKEVYANEDGEFSIEIPWHDHITLQATKGRYSIFSATYSDGEYEGIEKVDYNMGLAFIDDLLTDKEEKKVVKIQKFYFDRGKSNITLKIKTELDKVVDAVQRFPQLKLTIESHTNSKGSKRSNQQLSQRRSEAIKTYLTTNGLSSANIKAVGYGEEKLVNNCADGVYCLQFLHNQNERSYIVISNFDEL
ncbi:OmpA family protein [Maribacter sp. HTCC2170]|uniref:OmpA family protein n=1 Tax=Maribacter sp. (strain HTCC2170 / KCCM 42371) TaxID=313603 RepID=UPI00006BD4E0|nr:OmpA family protein [Maribacter sp. HTCC2170]EAR02188.1 OmpA family protein [Maribacter sp. HTCC2170]